MSNTEAISKQQKRPQLNRDYAALKFEAMVLYVKYGLSADAISKRLNVSMRTLQNWNKAGRWKELRPDLELLSQHKAAGMYIEKGMKESEIAMHLGISETRVKLWAYQDGWDAARLISKAEKITADIVAAFCLYYKKSFPDDAAKVDVVEEFYINSIRPKI